MNYIGSQINESPTIVEKAGADVQDGRCLLYKYDDNGQLVVATAGTDVIAGIGLVESGYNDVTGVEAGKVVAGDDLTVQIKDIGLVKAGGAIKKGAEVTANAKGMAVEAADGNYVIGIAQDKADAEGDFIYIQIVKYKK